jgi:hypothetical protein
MSIYLSICLSLGNAALLLLPIVIKLFTKREGRIVKEEIGEKGFEVMGFILT